MVQRVGCADITYIRIKWLWLCSSYYGSISLDMGFCIEADLEAMIRISSL